MVQGSHGQKIVQDFILELISCTCMQVQFFPTFRPLLINKKWPFSQYSVLGGLIGLPGTHVWMGKFFIITKQMFLGI